MLAWLLRLILVGWRFAESWLRQVGFWGRSDNSIPSFTPIALESFHGAAIDPFEQDHEFAAFDLDWLVLPFEKAHLGKLERSRLQALGEDCPAVEIPPERLDEIAAMAAKKEQVSGVWVLRKQRLHMSTGLVQTKMRTDGERLNISGPPAAKPRTTTVATDSQIEHAP